MKALNDSLYPVIFRRKSARSYSNAPVPEDFLVKLRDFMTETVPLLPSEKAAFEIQPHKGSAMKIAAYAKNEPAAFINLAFMLQQTDLFIQSNGMGALWNATVRASEKQMEGLPYGICLVFGTVNENAFRTGNSEFDRKKAEEITDSPDNPAAEAVRLSPSARNRQPWFLSCKEGQIDFYCRKIGLLGNTLLKGLQWIDIGIAVCHAVLALQKGGFSVSVASEASAAEKEGYIYMLSLDYEQKKS